VLAASSAGVAAGWLLRYPELAFVGYVGIALLLLAGCWMLLAPDLLAVRDIEPYRVAEGDPARGVLLVRNLSARRSPPILAIERVGNSTVTVPVPGLGRGESHETTYSLPTDRRGVYPVGPFSIGHSDPFRLLASTRTYQSSAQLTVHPRVHVVAPLPTGINRDMEGPTSASSPRGGIAFHSLRPYEWGDSFRDVHWKKSAQTGQLVVCHKVIPDEPRMLLVVDTSSASYAGDEFEDVARVVASLCMAAIRGGYPVTVRTTGGAVAVAETGRDSAADMLDLLAGVEPSAGDPGLVALAGMPPGRAATSLGVVTAGAAREDLAVVSQVRAGFLMASLVRIERAPVRGSEEALQGVFSLVCPDSETFARRWNASLGR
jgi:uncharacterized protein (DUF58 family)